MQSVIVITPRLHDLALRIKLKKRWNGFLVESGEQFAIAKSSSRIYIGRDDNIALDYDDKELKEILSIIENPIFYYINFSDIKLCKEVLAAIAYDNNILIDNDFGLRMRGTDYVNLIKADPLWNWIEDHYSQP